MLASHYAAPVDCVLAADSALFEEADASSATVAKLNAGDRFRLLDDSLGWAWGYAGDEGLVGYVPSEALA